MPLQLSSVTFRFRGSIEGKKVSASVTVWPKPKPEKPKKQEAPKPTQRPER